MIAPNTIAGQGGDQMSPRFRRVQPGTNPRAMPQVPGAAPMVQPSGVKPLTETAQNLGGVQPQAPGADPNLRSQVFTPGADPRLSGAQGATDAAAAAIQTAPQFSAASQNATQRYRSLLPTPTDPGKYVAQQDQAVANLGGPNRTDLAKRALADFDTANAEGLKERYRTVGQNAARLGRLGMGDTGKEVVNVGRQYEQDRMLKANELARSVAEGDIGDRYRTLDSVSGLRGRESGIASGLRGEDLDRYKTSADLGYRDASSDTADRYGRYDNAQSLEDLINTEGQSNRNEYRTERGYQGQQDQQTLENRIKERELGNSEMDQRLRQAIAQSYAGNQGAPSLDELLAMYGGGR